ncbi:E3 ubiquitin-protein ligase TRIM33 [Nematolebias whitei]|uniref:E3 ubiquitin-protein ligase TRIM33 n=1 Tax=Nematolebias whitei TaxID=451745 RepID=UPI001897A90C|nr:E3 ubiquitin-protein ligase TRIM33 [Nematolebias whitei]
MLRKYYYSGFVSPTKFCKLHSSEPLKLFCLTCVQLTCRDCQLVSHKNHSFGFVSEVSENLKKQLDSYRQLLGQKMEESTRSLRDMETRLKFLACCELFQTVDLQRVFKMLVQFLKRRFDSLLKEIRKVYESEKEMIKDRMLKVKQLQESHRSVSGAVQKARNTTDLLVLLNCTEQVKPRLMDLVRQDLSPPPNMTNVSIHTDSKFVEDLLTFGKVQESWIPFSVSEQLTKEMEKLSDLSLSSSPLTVTPPATSSQLLSSFTSVSNSVFSPASSKTNSITTSSSSSIQSGFSSKTNPQTRTSTDASQPVQVSHSTSHQSYPRLFSSSNLLSSSLTFSNPNTRENPVSLVASVSPFTMRSPPSSSALTSDSPSLSQTLNICDPPRTTVDHHSVSAFPSTLTSLVPPISSLGFPKDPLTGTTMSTVVDNVLHRSSPISPSSQATKGPETSESNVTTPKCPASFDRINILSRSQLETDDEPSALSEDEDPPLILPLSETSDSENEDTKTSRQQDFSQPQWQPKVSLARLPVHLPPRATLLPSFYSVLRDGKEEIYLQESVINVPDDAPNDDSNEDFTDLPSSPGSPLSLEIISCAACSSPNASKICSDCGRGYHRDCHIPPVGPDIWSEWICSLCQDLTDPSDPYSSDRSQSPQSTQLSLQNQRRCETLLLHLKVEGCRQFSEVSLSKQVLVGTKLLLSVQNRCPSQNQFFQE